MSKCDSLIVSLRPLIRKFVSDIYDGLEGDLSMVQRMDLAMEIEIGLQKEELKQAIDNDA